MINKDMVVSENGNSKYNCEYIKNESNRPPSRDELEEQMAYMIKYF